MRRRDRIAGAVLLAATAVGALLLLATGDGARSSTLSRGAEGWAGLRGYLEQRGVEVEIVDRPLAVEGSPQGAEKGAAAGTLVLALPFQAPVRARVSDALEGHLRGGGHLLYAYSGSEPGAGEGTVLSVLGLSVEAARPDAPLAPMAWRRHTRAVWRAPVADGDASGGRGPLLFPAPDRVPTPPAGARVRHRTVDGTAVAFDYLHLGGRVVVVPAAALANSRLALGGNADLLEALAHVLPRPWRVDELHHGLVAPGAVPEAVGAGTVDLFLLHLLVLYAVGYAALARRFGPPWHERPPATGSAGAFFLGLGGLHHRLGHHAAAARLLLDRVRELDPDLELPPALVARAAGAGPDELVALAGDLTRLRTGLRHPPLRPGRPASEPPPPDRERR